MKNEPYSALAEILAIFSGTLIVASAMFADTFSNSYSAIQNNVALIHATNDTGVKPFLLTANDLLGKRASSADRMSNITLWLAIISGVGSFCVWFWGKKKKQY